MLRSLKDLERYTVRATDGDIGKLVNFMLDDQHWTIRYLVAKTDGFFEERRVLISPISLRLADWSTRCLHVALTRDKVKQSPNVDLNQPISRQQERDYYRYYGYPYYWGYTGLWGMGAYPSWLAAGSWNGPAGAHMEDDTDAHLRSANEVRGYHIQGSDDDIGHIDDFVIDDETWEVRYLVIDTSNWGFGKKVLVAPHWTNFISWEQRTVYIELSREEVKGSPEWNPSQAPSREYEASLYDHYGRLAYWDDGERPTRVLPPRQPMSSHR